MLLPRLSGVGPALLHLHSFAGGRTWPVCQALQGRGVFAGTEAFVRTVTPPTLSCHFSKADTIGESPGCHSRKLERVQGIVANEWGGGALFRLVTIVSDCGYLSTTWAPAFQSWTKDLAVILYEALRMFSAYLTYGNKGEGISVRKWLT